MARNDIEIAVTQAYLNILYANENVKISRQTVESSAAQLERSKALLEAGSIAPSDYAQMESQYSSDKYQLTVSQTSLDQNILTLKQLLELGLDESFDVQFPRPEQRGRVGRSAGAGPGVPAGVGGDASGRKQPFERGVGPVGREDRCRRRTAEPDGQRIDRYREYFGNELLFLQSVE